MAAMRKNGERAPEEQGKNRSPDETRLEPAPENQEQMPKRKLRGLSIETKVGLFFLLGLILLGVITFRVANLGELFKHKAYYKVSFPHASGLNPDDIVAVAGLKVGKIKSLKLEETGVMMELIIDPKVLIRRDAVATIAWGGLLGNRYIDISLGSRDEPFLAPGSEIMHGGTVELTDVLFKLDEAASQLKDLFKSSGAGSKIQNIMDNLVASSQELREHKGTLGKLLGSDEVYNKVVAIADDLKSASSQLNGVIGDNKERIASLLEKLEAAVPEAKDAFASVKRMTEQANSGKGILGELLNDETMAQDLRDSLARLRTSLDKIEKVTQNMQEGPGLFARLTNDAELATNVADAIKSMRVIAERVEKGDNTLARLTRDKDLYNDIKKLVDDGRETLRSVKEQVPVGTFASLLLTAF